MSNSNSPNQEGSSKVSQLPATSPSKDQNMQRVPTWMMPKDLSCIQEVDELNDKDKTLANQSTTNFG
jgi:hypothetical protein